MTLMTIPLHGRNAADRFALVDDQDYDLVVAYRWHADERYRADGSVTVVYARTGHMYMHSLLTGWPQTDHANHDGLDNRRANLRAVTGAQNCQNRRMRSDNAWSTYKGVTAEHFPALRPWRARIKT